MYNPRGFSFNRLTKGIVMNDQLECIKRAPIPFSSIGMGIYTSFRLSSALRESYSFQEYIDFWQTHVFVSTELRAIALREKFGEMPHTKTPVIFAMIGLPQTGKSTIAKAIASAVAAINIEDSALHNYLQTRGIPDFPYFSEVFILMLDIALRRGYNVVLDSDFYNPIKRVMLEAIARKAGAKVYYIHVECGKSVLINRLQNPSHEFGEFWHDVVVDRVPSIKERKINPSAIYRRLLLNAVIDDYSSKEYRKTFCHDDKISILNSGSKKVAELTAAIHSWKILSKHGKTTEISACYQNAWKKSVP